MTLKELVAMLKKGKVQSAVLYSSGKVDLVDQHGSFRFDCVEHLEAFASGINPPKPSNSQNHGKFRDF